MQDAIKKSSELLKLCHSLPKIDLHAHLNGSIRKNTLFELLKEERDRDELGQLLKKTMSFENAFKIFKLSSKIITGLDVIARITREMMEDWAKMNCIYLEIRTTLKSINGATLEDYLRTVLREIEFKNADSNMQTRLIISLNREHPLSSYAEVLKVYNNLNDAHLKRLIVGIDFCGYEPNEKHTYDEVFPVFNQFRELGLKVTVHMGETENYQIMDFAKFRPDRVAHTYFFTDEHFEQVMKNKIPVEICPTGGYCIKNLTSYKDIPFKKYHKKTINHEDEEFTYELYCINTDDTMLFNTDVTQEYLEVADNFNFTPQELKDLVKRTVNFIFDPSEELKNRLRSEVDKFYI